MIQEAIKNADELRQWFFEKRNNAGMLKSGIMVSTKIRRDALTSIYQNKILVEGRTYHLLFENLGGGVYRAYLGDL